MMDSFKRVNFENNRFYCIQNSWMPSVTSVLKLVSDNKIAEWRRRVGVANADAISKMASERGTRIHAYCERALKGEELQLNLEDAEYFSRAFSNELLKITNVLAIEECVFSEKHGFAGTVDCIGEYDGVLSIIDFKTSTRLKQKRYIESYFMQTAAYSIAHEEMTGRRIEQLVIIIGVADLMETQVFIEKIDGPSGNWRELFFKYLRLFKEKFSYPDYL